MPRRVRPERRSLGLTLCPQHFWTDPQHFWTDPQHFWTDPAALLDRPAALLDRPAASMWGELAASLTPHAPSGFMVSMPTDLEAYFAIPCMGAVLHPLNLRLHPNELGYIARHAEDRLVLVDESLLPLLQQFLPQVPSVEHVIVLRDGPPPGDERLDYETLLAAERHGFEFRRLEENQAAIICYTSGTTGNPKGVAYSHRSTVLHTLVACMADTIGVSEADSVLLTQHLEARFAKFWLPDDYVFVHQIPRTSTGKFQKLRLREEHGDLLVRRRPPP